jgi:hypothetical protein
MKRLQFIILLLMVEALFSSIKAQDLIVYSVTGTAKIITSKSSITITPRQKLDMETIINFGTGSKLVLIDLQTRKQYTLSATGTYTVEKLIAQSKNSVKSLSAMYLTYLMKQINGTGVLTSKTAVDDTFASIERGTSDSLFTEETNTCVEVPDTISK